MPRTDAAKCQECLANGDTLGASMYCPAGTFISSQGVGGVVAAGAEAICGFGAYARTRPVMSSMKRLRSRL